MVAIQDRREQTNVLAACRIEAGGTALSDTLGFGEVSQVLIGRRGIIDDSQSVEVATVASQCLLLVIRAIASPSLKGIIREGLALDKCTRE